MTWWCAGTSLHRTSAFYLAGGRLQAAVSVDRHRDVRAALRLIAAGGEIDRRGLADESCDLRRPAVRVTSRRWRGRTLYALRSSA